MTDDLESRLRETLTRRASSIGASDLSSGTVRDATSIALEPVVAPVRRPVTLALTLGVLMLVVATGLATIVLSRSARGPAEAPVAAGPAPSLEAGPISRAWPLTNDEPLPTPVPDDPRTPDLVARAYLTEVVGLAHDWPVQALEQHDDTAVLGYILQDVPSEVRLARAESGSWFVTSASTDLARPEVVGPTGSGLDVSVAAGPRTPRSGAKVRITALAADGRVLATTLVRAAPTPDGSGAAAAIASLGWDGTELAAAVRADVVDDHDADTSTPDAVIGHWTSGIAQPQPVGVPADYDVVTAEPVHVGSVGTVDDATLAYVRARFPDHPAPGVKVDRARTRGPRAIARWEVADAEAAGLFFLRQLDGRWDVIASTTDGVDLSGVRIESSRLQGRATTRNRNSLFADVLRLDGTPVPGSPRPDGHPGAAYRFATAAGPSSESVDIDVPVSAPALLRVGLVGGTILAISEVRVS